AEMKAWENNDKSGQKPSPLLASGAHRGESDSCKIEGHHCSPRSKGSLIEKCSEAKNNDQSNKKCWHEMARRGRQPVFVDDAHFPVTVLHVLTEQRRKRAARPVPALNPRRLKDTAACARQPQVVFIVLVAD